MKKVLAIGLGLFLCMMTIQASATTPEDIEESILKGIAWLLEQQNEDGSFADWEKVACTAFAVVKLEDRAFELGMSPFNEVYEYSQNVTAGLNYIFSQADTYEGTNGICFGKGRHVSYHTGIAMMAIAAGRDPDRVVNVPGSIVHGWTYKEVLQANIDFYASYQNPNGGWQYEPFDPEGFSDNSITGYVVLGLAYAESPLYGFDCTIPDSVKNKLNNWIDHIQIEGGNHDGGSGYGGGDTSNVLRAGNLIFEMAFMGDTPDTPRMQRALAFLSRAWNDPDWLWEDMHSYPGWYGNPDWHGEPDIWPMPDWWKGLEERYHGWTGPHYQAMYCLMKGLTFAGIDTINVDGIDVDWYDAFAERILYGQNEDGSWDRDYWGWNTLATEWALLTLEAIAPPEKFINVFLDIKPGSCPNPLNLKSKGVLPVAILGTEDFDVTTIDPVTILLTREGYEGVAPLRWAYEDVATPFDGELCECHDLNGDGYLDLTLKFKMQELVETLYLGEIKGETISLTIIGNLKEEAGSTPIRGSDCVRVQ
jgi:hypothetical protein